MTGAACKSMAKSPSRMPLYANPDRKKANLGANVANPRDFGAFPYRADTSPDCSEDYSPRAGGRKVNGTKGVPSNTEGTSFTGYTSH
jgi:hypothetical protein